MHFSPIRYGGHTQFNIKFLLQWKRICFAYGHYWSLVEILILHLDRGVSAFETESVRKNNSCPTLSFQIILSRLPLRCEQFK